MNSATDWNGFKGKLWGFVFRSKTLRYLLGFYIFSNKHGKKINRLIRERLSRGGVFVDMGAGSGFYTTVAAKVHPSVRVHAVELSPTMLEQLRKTLTKNKIADSVTIHHENVEDSGLGSGLADVIVASNVLHELKTPKKFLSETFRILKNDGVVIACEFIDNAFGRKFLSHHKDDVYGPYKLEDLRNYFVEAGFNDVQVDHHNNRLLAVVRK